MKKILNLLWIGIGLIFAVIIIAYQKEINSFFNSTSASNYLLIVVIVVDFLGNFITYYLEKRDKTEDKKQTHAETLIDKTFSRLAKIGILQDVDNRQYVIIPKIAKKEDDEDLDEDNGEDYEYVTDIPQPYRDWALQHLKSYEKMEKAFNDIHELARDHNGLLNEAENELQKQLKNIFTKHFPDIKKFDEHTKIGYKPEKIVKILSHNMYMESWDLPQEDPNDDYVWEFSSKEVFNQHDRVYQIIGGYDDTLVIYSEKQKIDIDKLNQLLTSLGKDSHIQKQFDEILLVSKNCEKARYFFEYEMKLLIENLKNGVKLKGKCDLGH